MRIAFAGTSNFAQFHLQCLIDGNFTPVVVFSQPDRPKGRGKRLLETPVKQLATKHGIEVLQPANINAQLDIIQSLNLDLLVVVAFGQILSKSLLDTPLYGSINVHASLLPRWRGAAPIERAIESGDEQTGITIMRMSEKLDEGDILLQQAIPIKEQGAVELYRQLSILGGQLLLDYLNRKDEITPTIQEHEKATYATKIHKSEMDLDFQQDCQTLLQKIRAFNGSLGCRLSADGIFIKIWEAKKADSTTIPLANLSQFSIGQLIVLDNQCYIKCINGVLQVLTLQLPNKSKLSAKDYINGLKNRL